MNLRPLARAAGLSVFLLFSQNLFSSTELLVQLGNDQIVHLLLSLTPPTEDWEQTSPSTYAGNGYRLALQQTLSDRRSELRVEISRTDAQSFTVQRFQACWEIPDPDLYAIWTYNRFPENRLNYRSLKNESFEDITRPNYGIPFAMGLTRAGVNLVAAGILSQTRVMSLSGEPMENGYCIRLANYLPIRTARFTETLYADRASTDWFETARAYGRWADRKLKYKPFPISAGCYSPMYDTWYWSHDRTSLDLYWETLSVAKQLGFETYLFDAGWESQTGELFKWLAGSLGNYFAPSSKLPFFDKFLRRVRQSFGMNLVLWVTPYGVGRESIYYPSLKDAHTHFRNSNRNYRGGDFEPPHSLPLTEQFRENLNLCPRNPATAAHLKLLFSRLAANYQPNGYWLDFQEMVPFLCEARHAHARSFGAGYNAAQEEIANTIQTTLKNPTIELRYPFANLNNKRFANLWQSLDFPGDFDGMRLCTLMMRPFSEGVVMGTDEMYWPESLDDSTVAKFVATTVLTGVPAIGANFLLAPASHAEIVRSWLSFYKAHRLDLTQGEFRPFGDFLTPDQKIESPQKAFIYLRSSVPAEVDLTGAPREIYVSNCTDRDAIHLTLRNSPDADFRLEVLNVYLKPIARRTLRLGGNAMIVEEVPQGGLLRLIRKVTS